MNTNETVPLAAIAQPHSSEKSQSVSLLYGFASTTFGAGDITVQVPLPVPNIVYLNIKR